MMASDAPGVPFSGPLTEATELASVLDHVPAIIDLTDLDLRHRFANWANSFWYGRRPHEIVGLHAEDLLGPARYAESLPHLDAVREGVPQAFERTITTATGERRYVVVNYEPYLVDGEIAGVLILSFDVTGRVRADFARRETARRLADLDQQQQTAAENERLALSRLDGMAADLAEAAAADGRCRELLLEVARDIADAARSLRLVRAGRPDAAAARGPEAVVRARLQQAAPVLGFEPGLVVLGVLDGLDESRTALVLEVLDEALSNVARHARAGRVDVTVSVEDRDLVVVVADDGDGAVRARPGSGLDRLRHRAVDHGGRCTWVISDGTTLEWRVPLSPLSAPLPDPVGRTDPFVPDPASARGVRLPPPDYRTPETLGLDADELHAVLDQVPMGLTVWDAEIRNRYANRTAVRWMRQPDPAAMLGRRFTDLLPADVSPRVEPLVRAALAGTHTIVERPFGPFAGLPEHIRTEYLPRRVDGEVEGLYVQVTDIGERLHAESAVRADVERVAAMQARHQADEDVHHLAIQQLFAAALRLDSAHATCVPACTAALERAMAPFDETIVALRRSVVSVG
jgi:PAS domain-containing protein